MPRLARAQPPSQFRRPADLGPVYFDNASSSVYEAALSTYNWTHVVGTNLNRLLVVGVSIFAAGSVSSITWNPGASQSLQKLRADVNGIYDSEIWYLIAPASGSGTITVTLSTSLTSIAGAASWWNVDQTNPFSANAGGNGTNTPASGAVTPGSVNNRVFANLSCQTANDTVTNQVDQAPHYRLGGAIGSQEGSEMGTIVGLTSTTLSWSGLGALDSWAVSLGAIQPPQPFDTWQPPIPGVGWLSRGVSQLYAARVGQSFLLWHLPVDGSTAQPQPDTYQPPVPDSAFWKVVQRQAAVRAVEQTQLWFAPQDVSVPQPQPDTYQGPVPIGEAWHAAAQQTAVRARVASQLTWFFPSDLGTALPQPDTYQGPVPDAAFLKTMARQYQQAMVGSLPLLWTSDADLPPIAVIDTYQAPLLGTLMGALRDYATRARLASGFLLGAPADLSTILAQPDTYQPPVPGIGNLGRATQQYLTRVWQASLLFHTPEDVSVTLTQSDTYQPPIPGLGVLGRALGANTLQARIAQALLFLSLPPVDAGLQALVDQWWTLWIMQRLRGENSMAGFNRFISITPSDTVNLAQPENGKLPDAIYVGASGVMVAVMNDGTTASFTVVAGTTVPISPIRINATNTTASLLIALHSL